MSKYYYALIKGLLMSAEGWNTFCWDAMCDFDCDYDDVIDGFWLDELCVQSKIVRQL